MNWWLLGRGEHLTNSENACIYIYIDVFVYVYYMYVLDVHGLHTCCSLAIILTLLLRTMGRELGDYMSNNEKNVE